MLGDTVNPGDPINILMVDDEPKNLMALEAVLASEDRNLVRAGSGDEALRHLLNDSFAVVLLDVHMPGLTGFETAALMRGRAKTREIPIIFLTAAHRSEANVAEGYSAGAVDYIVKPFDPEILRSKVAVFVELARKSDQVKRQAQQLAEAAAFLQSILDSSTEYAIIAQDLEGRVLAWNEGARRVYGYTADEMVGKQNARLLHAPEDVAAGRVEAALATVLQGGKLEGEFERVRKDGRRFAAQLLITVLRDAVGREVGFVVISKDVTQQKIEAERARLLVREQAARAEAEAAQRRFAFLAEASNIVASSLDAERTLQRVAGLAVPLLAEACSIDVQEEDGQVRRFASAGVARSDEPAASSEGTPWSPSFGSDVALVLRAGQSLHRGGTSTLDRSRPPDSSEWASGVGSPIGPVLVVPMVAHGRTLGALSLSRSQPYTRDDQILVEDLAGRVAMAVDNSRLYREARDAVRIRGEFAASASHDLKTPLTVIKGQAKLLQRRVERIDTTDTRRIVTSLETIDATTTKMAGIIDELLEVGRLEIGRPLELNPQPTDLVDVVRGVVTALAETVSRHHLKIEVADSTLIGHWDPVRLERVVDNLLGNAIKYSPAGGDIVLAMSRGGDGSEEHAVLRVHDSGVGIPSEELPRVFERFFRGSNVAGTIAGTGIGLAGVRHIVEEHGGTISLSSEEGVGTTVTVALPLARGAESGPSRSATPA